MTTVPTGPASPHQRAGQGAAKAHTAPVWYQGTAQVRHVIGHAACAEAAREQMIDHAEAAGEEISCFSTDAFDDCLEGQSGAGAYVYVSPGAWPTDLLKSRA